MKQKASDNNYPDKLSYYSFLTLIVTVPLAFTTYIENSFDLVKNVVLKFVGGIFIISSLILLYKKSRDNKLVSSVIIFDKTIDPYVLFFLLAALFSTIFSLNSSVSYNGGYVRQIGFVTYLYLFIIYIFSQIILNDRNKFQKVLAAMEVCGVIIALYSIIQFIGIDPFKIQPPGNLRPKSTIGHSIFTAGFLLMIFPFSFLRLFRYKIISPGTLIPLLIIAAVVITQTRTAYAAIFIEIVLLLVLYPLVFGKQKEKFKKLVRTSVPVVLILLLVLSAVIFFAHDNIYVKRFLSIFNITANPRWLLWRDSFEIFKKYPITGSGIANFSNAFEDIYTREFRMMDVKGIYDNAHNNFINILCTMGLVGMAAYLLLLFRSAYLGFKSLFSAEAGEGQKYFLLAFVSVISGYIVYSLADFDDISILLYLYVYLAMLKAVHPGAAGKKPRPFRFRSLLPALQFTLLLLASSYFIYNMYHSFILFKADNYFKTSNEMFLAGDNRSAFVNVTKASDLNPVCPEYRYEGTFILLNEAINDTTLSEQQKSSLLEQAEKEIVTAREVHPSSKLCQAALCLVLFEMGRLEEAEMIRDELFSKDSLSIDFRTNLARYYMRAGQYDKAREQVDVLSRYDPDNIEANITLAHYYFGTGDYVKTRQLCERILRCDPNNRIAKQFLFYLKDKY